MGMSIDECFEFDYLMEADRESRENAEREDRKRDRKIARDYRGSWGFYVPRNKSFNLDNEQKDIKIQPTDRNIDLNSTKTTHINTISAQKYNKLKWKSVNWWWLVFCILFLSLAIFSIIHKENQEKRLEERRIKQEEIKAQELLETEINSWYEKILEVDPSERLRELDEKRRRNSPYDWCSYIWDDLEWHMCESNVVKNDNSEVKNQLDNEYIPETQIPVAQIPDTSYAPVAQIPTATIPKSQTPKSQNISSWKNIKETYYNEYTDEYFDNYDDYYDSMLWIEEYRKRWYDSYDDYYWDYFDKNKADNFYDYYDVYSDYDDYGWNYDFADFRDDFYDDHYWEYF